MSDQMKCEECNGTGVAERIGGYDRPCDVCRGEGELPTASVDAEPVAFLYVDDDGNAAFEHSRSSRYPYWAETPLYTEAQMQARADAARREALRMLGDLLAVIHRDGGHRQDEVGTEQAWMEAMMIVPTLFTEENPNAG